MRPAGIELCSTAVPTSDAPNVPTRHVHLLEIRNNDEYINISHSLNQYFLTINRITKVTYGKQSRGFKLSNDVFSIKIGP